MSNYSNYRELREIQGNPISRPGRKDYHKTKRSERGGRKSGSPKPSKWERRKIIAWDGEGANVYRDGQLIHIYNLLANSDGTRIVNPNGLSTEECFKFFLMYGDPDAINVIYGGSYDVNMILRDVPPERLNQLWREGRTQWQSWVIYYAHRKKLTIQHLTRKGKQVHKDTFTLWDVLGYFQATFVVACRKWLGDLPILDEIEQMKFERSVFTVERLPQIIDYNKKECELLVILMGALFDALDNVGIRLIRYDGAGSIAAALLKANSVKEHYGEIPSEAVRWSQHSYSGGRIEAPKIGNAEVPIYRYDINSAYPSACLDLPSYSGATWSFDKKWDGQDCSMVRVRWCHRTKAPFYPLFYREYDGAILYPSMGEGIYWGVEVRNLIDYCDPDDYEIVGACNVHLKTDYKPFKFLADIYHARLKLKQSGNMAAEAFKLGMNSIYGKLAQQAGYRNGRVPTYHNLLWAGQVTATTRAILYRASMQNPNDCIAFATDAILSTSPLRVTEGTGLGAWTADEFSGITIVQPGVYWLRDKDGNWHDKYRGFDRGSLLRDHLVGCWLLGQDYTARLTRFVGMGSALASSDFYGHWRTWETSERILSLTPSGKRLPNRGNTKDLCYWERLCDTIPMPNLDSEFGISKAYPLLWDKDLAKDMEEIKSLQVIEDELLDSYA